jgi:hypothetical protein
MRREVNIDLFTILHLESYPHTRQRSQRRQQKEETALRDAAAQDPARVTAVQGQEKEPTLHPLATRILIAS